MSYKTIGQINEEMSRQEFNRSMFDDKLDGIEHKIEIVNKKPEQFQFNMLYILADGSRIWVWIETEPFEKVEKQEVIESEEQN